MFTQNVKEISKISKIFLHGQKASIPWLYENVVLAKIVSSLGENKVKN